MNTKLQEFFKEADTRFEDAYKHLWSNYSMNSIQKSEIICDEMIFPILDQGLITCIEDLNESIKIVSSLLMSNGVNMSSKTIKMIKDKTYIKWKNRSALNPYVMAKDGKIRINQMSFADYFSENHYKYTGLSWVHYNGAFYEEVSIHKIKAIIANNLEPTDVHESMITSIEKICEHECFTSISSFDSNEKTINTIDGFLNIDTAKIEHHTPERLSLRCIPFHYNPDVKKSDCPIFMGFLHTICSGDKEKIELILQMMGYTFTSHNKAKAFFLLEGVPDTGKSTLLEIIRKLVGENNAVNIPLDELNLQFMGSKLIGKLANICGELSSSKLPDTTKLKMITGSDAITIDRKYKEPIEVKISTKIILAANSIPENLISDAGVKARLVRIKFDNIIPKGKQDVYLIDKICKEMDAIFSLSIKALHRLKRNNYIFPQANHESKRETIANTISECEILSGMLTDIFEIKTDSAFPCAQAYLVYKNYCLTINRVPCRRGKFKECLKTLGVKEGQIGQNRCRSYLGLNLSPDKIDSFFNGKELKRTEISSFLVYNFRKENNAWITYY